MVFQFYIVRLKATGVCSSASLKAVSILYSSIKRAMTPSLTWLPDSFQFYIVRLKGAQVYSVGFVDKEFQFYIVRLKDYPGLLIKACVISFNSI